MVSRARSGVNLKNEVLFMGGAFRIFGFSFLILIRQVADNTGFYNFCIVSLFPLTNVS